MEKQVSLPAEFNAKLIITKSPNSACSLPCHQLNCNQRREKTLGTSFNGALIISRTSFLLFVTGDAAQITQKSWGLKKRMKKPHFQDQSRLSVPCNCWIQLGTSPFNKQKTRKVQTNGDFNETDDTKQAHISREKPFLLLLCCLMSSDVGWRIWDKLRPVREHGSVLLYVHGNHKAPFRGGRTVNVTVDFKKRSTHWSGGQHFVRQNTYTVCY